ncbi:MAG: acyl-CoA dehydratase activase [Deltaproteobacteria bacterium]
MKVLGICLGASTVSIAELHQQDGRIRVQSHCVRPHEGNPQKALLEAMASYPLSSFDRIAATGRKFRELLNITSISEPQAVEYAYRHLRPRDVFCPAVVSAGGETFMIYAMNRQGLIANVLTGNKCASGTGEFFLQQLRRMNVSLEEAAGFAATEEPHAVSGRCSVFCKSDCTHATNKGIPKANVTAGLCKMMAGKILELLKKIPRRHIMVTGGAARNAMMIEYLRRDIEGLIIPAEAPYFEALGAALWACENETRPVDIHHLVKDRSEAFDTHPPLADFQNRVEFKTMSRARVQPGDICVLGLDVGSTTTKAVLMRRKDDTLLADVYLRTSGDPIGAARSCYRSIFEQISRLADPSSLIIEGIGICGSGRQIAGLHAMTDGVMNEIIAHATAAAHYDPEVDTIFEIGGQDAKYTYLVNSVASDYAMNEACSAGTGSFLEESALETLGVPMEGIADLALQGARPPNFNDQCAAFIASDMKNAIAEGRAREDILAGLVYSVCMNYANRVKGNRPVGKKIFMQGGVCYNRAVPLAMAALTGSFITVPPEPGLMGAYGAALAVRRKIDRGRLTASSFDLAALADRTVRYGRSFTCKGAQEHCDRRCEISVIEMGGKKYPFGGTCNKYYNLQHGIQHDSPSLDSVAFRQTLIFEKFAAGPAPGGGWTGGRIGFNRSFLTHTYYPLYSTFFAELGYEPILADACTRTGVDERNASFCYPAELAHGFFNALLEHKPQLNFIFLPHFKALPASGSTRDAQVCPFVQGETFYLQSTFRPGINTLKKSGIKILTPLIDLTDGLSAMEKPLAAAAREMGAGRAETQKAFRKALFKQQACFAEMQEAGRRALADLKNNPDDIALVIFGRPYSGMAPEANKGIPQMFASRGYRVLPLDFLPLDHEQSKDHMYWGTGQQIMKAAAFIKKHPRLFGVYITNFSCGPDSFLMTYFRDVMKDKPSLTLELDSHTAGAGLETRIEAFLDVISAYRQLPDRYFLPPGKDDFVPAKTVFDGAAASITTSGGESLPLTHRRVTVLFPSMGEIGAQMLAAVFTSEGFRTFAHPAADEQILKIGRAHTSCKECLPLILTTGSLINYLNHRRKPGELVAYFMPTGTGPCRFGQYAVFMEDLILRMKIPDVAILSITSQNSYAGLNGFFRLRTWWAAVISDALEDIRSLILVKADDPEQALQVFEEEAQSLVGALTQTDFQVLTTKLGQSLDRLKALPGVNRPRPHLPVVALVGEIFVRRDNLSRQRLTEKLAEKGFAVICSPVGEWILYTNYLVRKGITGHGFSIPGRLKFLLVEKYVERYTRKLHAVMKASGLVLSEPVDVDDVIRNASPFISPHLTGEAILTIGSAIREIASSVCGVISIGPFGCMPARLSESILNEAMHRETKIAADPQNRLLGEALSDFDELPFLSIESDGSPFPQIIQAKLEAFCLRAGRLHEAIKNAGQN